MLSTILLNSSGNSIVSEISAPIFYKESANHLYVIDIKHHTCFVSSFDPSFYLIFFPVYKLIPLYHESANTLFDTIQENKAIVSRIAFLHKLLQKRQWMPLFLFRFFIILLLIHLWLVCLTLVTPNVWSIFPSTLRLPVRHVPLVQHDGFNDQHRCLFLPSASFFGLHASWDSDRSLLVHHSRWFLPEVPEHRNLHLKAGMIRHLGLFLNADFLRSFDIFSAARYAKRQGNTIIDIYKRIDWENSRSWFARFSKASIEERAPFSLECGKCLTPLSNDFVWLNVSSVR